MSCMEISYKRRAAITARRKAAELFGMTSPKTVHLDEDPRRETACEISEKPAPKDCCQRRKPKIGGHKPDYP